MNLMHYTNFDAMHGIIQEDGLHFWATRYDKLNDNKEFSWMYEPLVKRLAENNALTEKELNELYEKFPYVISFSDSETNVSLWKSYARNGKGVVLAFDYQSIVPTPEQLCGFGAEWDVLLPVLYANADNKMDVLQSATENFRNFGYGNANDEEKFEDEIYSCAFVKEEIKWAAEKEWRYARIRDREMMAEYREDQEPEFFFPEDVHDVKYYSRGNEKIPYLEVSFQAKALKKVIIGSNADFDAEHLRVKQLMESFGDKYAEVKIEKSDVEL